MAERPSPSPSSVSVDDDPRLVVVCGVPGTGKTTVARLLADRLPAAVLRTDVVRKERVPDPEYTAAETRAVYEALLERASRCLAAGDSAVVDGTFRRAAQRERATALAADAGVASTIVKVECEEAVVGERIRARTDDESDAGFADHLALKAEFESLTRPHVTIDNSGSLAATTRQIRDGVLADAPPARHVAPDGGVDGGMDSP